MEALKELNSKDVNAIVSALENHIRDSGIDVFVGVAQIKVGEGQIATFQVVKNAGMIEMLGAGIYISKNAEYEVTAHKMRENQKQMIAQAQANAQAQAQRQAGLKGGTDEKR